MTEPTRIYIKPIARWLPLLIVLLGGLALAWSAHGWMILLVGLGGAWLFDRLYVRSLVRGLRLHRELRYDWAQVGDELEERFTLSKRGSLPALWVELLDHSTLPDYQVNVATGVDGDSDNVWSARHTCTRRGVFTLGPTTLRTGTPFGLYTLEFEYRAQVALMVMPSVVPLPEIQVAPGGRVREGRRRTSSFEQTVSAASVRDYRPGDPFRLIHWRSVAHRDELMARTLESTPAGDWWIWLDLDAQAQAGTGEDSTVEHGVMLAASLAERGLRAGRAVGLVVNGHELVWLAPRGGEGQRLEILRALALVQAGPRPLAETLAATRSAVRDDASLVIITPAVEGTWLDALGAWTWGGTRTTVLLLDRATYGGVGSTDRTRAVLAEWNIPHTVIPADLFDRAAARPGRQGHWEWGISATGRAISRVTPGDQTWRSLG